MWGRALVAALLIAATATGSAAASSRLAVSGDALPGIKEAPATGILASTRAELRKAAPSLRGRIAAVGGDAARYTGGSTAAIRTLDVGAFELANATTARAVLKRWAAARPGGGSGIGIAVRVKAGDEAWRRGNSLAVVVDRGIAVLRVTPRSPTRARTLLIRIAVAQAQRLRDVLTVGVAERIGLDRGANGSLSKTSTVQLLSALYGPITGVRLPHNPAGRPGLSGTSSLAAAIALYPSLPEAQQAAVVRIAGGSPTADGAAARVPARAAATSCPERIDDDNRSIAANEAFRQRALALRSAIAAQLPGMRQDWDLCVYDAPRPTGTVIADSLGFNRSTPNGSIYRYVLRLPDLPDDACRIRVFHPEQISSKDFMLAHEVTHCLHFENFPGSTEPVWSSDGIANLAAFQVTHPAYDATPPGSHYDKWLKPSDWGLSLFARQYDALGFFGLVQQLTGQMMERIPAVWRAGTDTDRYAAAVGSDGEAVLNAWAPGLAGFPRPGGWQQNQPYPVPRIPSIPRMFDGSEQANPYTAKVVQLTNEKPYEPVVTISASGHVRLTDRTKEFVNPEQITLCMGGKCECQDEDDAIRPIPEHTDVENDVYIAMAGGPSAASVTIRRHPLTYYCRNDERRAPDPTRPSKPIKSPLVGRYVFPGPIEIFKNLPDSELRFTSNGSWSFTTDGNFSMSGSWFLARGASTVLISGGTDEFGKPCSEDAAYHFTFRKLPYRRSNGATQLLNTLFLTSGEDGCDSRNAALGLTWTPRARIRT